MNAILSRTTITLFVFFVLGIALIYISQSQNIGKDYIIPIGQALIGSTLIGILIDIGARQQFLKKASQEIFGYLVGQFFPREARDFINSFVRTEIILSALEYHYVFNKLQDDQVKMDVRVDYEVRNYSGRKVQYIPKLQIEESESPEIFLLSCNLGEESKYVLKGEELTPLFEREGVRAVMGKQITLEPVTENRDNPYRVSWHYSITKSIGDNDLISFGNITIGVKIRAQYDTRHFRIEIDEKEYNVTKIDDFTWKSSADNTLFLPRQHIRVRWWPVEKINKNLA